MGTEYKVKSISFTPEILEKVDKIVKERMIPGVNDRSALVNYALAKFSRNFLRGKTRMQFKRDFLSVGSFITIILLLASGITWAILQYNITIHNNGSIQAIGCQILDSTGNPITSINWGTINLGTSANQNIIVKNNGTIPITLSMITQNWNPTNASTFLTLSWNYAGQTIDPEQTLPLTLNLAVAPETSGIYDFSFDIVFTGGA